MHEINDVFNHAYCSNIKRFSNTSNDYLIFIYEIKTKEENCF